MSIYCLYICPFIHPSLYANSIRLYVIKILILLDTKLLTVYINVTCIVAYVCHRVLRFVKVRNKVLRDICYCERNSVSRMTICNEQVN